MPDSAAKTRTSAHRPRQVCTVLALAFTLVLVGCGQRGPLTLPKPAETAEKAEPSASARK